MDYLEYLGRRLVWLVVSLVVVIVVKRPRILKRLAIVSDLYWIFRLGYVCGLFCSFRGF